MNAVTHGLTAQASVLPGEDPLELEEMARSLLRQLRPRGVVQRMMAERVVSLAWKLRRVARAEEAVALQMEEASLRHWEEGAALAETQPIFRQFVGPRPERRAAGALLADSTWDKDERQGTDPRLRRLTQYELKLDAALRAAMRELHRLQKEADVFEDPGEEDDAQREECADPPARRPVLDAVIASPPENEPNELRVETEGSARGSADDASQENPGLRCGAPAACGEGPVEKTNPIPRDGNGGQSQAPQGVKPDSPA